MPPTSRRAHNKSRQGCKLCKSRKIKCDERQPCAYCTKKGVKCSLQVESERISRPPIFSYQQDPTFCTSDFTLFHHFVKKVAVEHADDAPSVVAWSDVADLATRHTYLLHNLLALSALHLRSTYPDQAETLEQIAAGHQARGIPMFREALIRDLETDSLPLFACSCILLPAHFAASKDPLSLIVNEETQGPPDWLLLLDGATIVTENHCPGLLESSLRPLLGPMIPVEPDDIDDSPADRELISLKDTIPAAAERKEDYRKLIDLLRYFYTLSNRGPSLLAKKTAALRFPPFLSRTGKDDLAKRHPVALIVMAFWIVLLFRIEDRWWLRGKVRPIALKIQQLLPTEHQHLIAWPLEQLGLHQNGANRP
ncbi:hypothetical protein F5Y19DRAFT_429167 [Xylariaceae sp. FL1651]|nr:hypothetical protein F5Y19DRAFT_429167 [Xylariaceae sp. FL1651]